MMITEDKGFILKKYLRSRRIKHGEIAKQLDISKTQFSAFINARGAMPDRCWEELPKFLPIDKAANKKGQFVFKKNILKELGVINAS